ncbi:MAG: type III-E CRISPR-associated gRAMP effector Cas7-11 [Desulfococcaceae bacterium]|jgi:CRISPR/Cas system CSM-associated protein Csm3 (group 7 of RAMP superfamily)|nr:type III-E CRISPR-associated gRAMP effector Cas7-11 [Desulfococcaceae bacterium]
MKTLTVTIHFLEPFRVIEWHKWDDRNSKRFMRGYSFARWHNSDDSDHPCNSGRPYITGTLVRSAFLKSVEQFLWMHNGIYKDMRCCPGKFKDSKAKIYHHPAKPEKLEAKRLRRRQTLKWNDPGDCSEQNPCPHCLLLGRFDEAGAGTGVGKKKEDEEVKKKFHVKFSNFDVQIQEEMPLEDMAEARIINRVDQEDGKAEDFVKIWEIDPDICGDFTGHIHLSGEGDKTEVRELIEKAAVLTDRIAGSLCSVTISEEAQKNEGLKIPSAENRNNDFNALAEKIENAFQAANKTVHLRLFADVIREMRCKDQSVLQNLPKGHKERGAKSADTYKAHFIWDEVKIEGKKLRNRLPEMFQDSGMEWTVFCQKLGQALYVSAKKSGPEQFPAPRPVGSAEGVHISDDPQTELEKSAGENTLHEILIRGQLTAKTPFFFGWSSGEGEEKSGEEQTSMRVLTTKDGSFRLPRSVLRGILRRDLKTVFGTGCRAELGHRSPCVCPVCRVMRQITIKDSRSTFKNPPRIRHRIRLDHASGTVAQGALFDMEVGPRGVRFPFELRLRSPEEKIPKELNTVLQRWSNGMAFLSGAAGTGKGRFQLDDAKWTAWNLKDDFEDYQNHLGGRNGNVKPENELPSETSRFPWNDLSVDFAVTTPFITRDPIGSLMLKPFEKQGCEEATDAICYQSEYVDKKGEKQEEYLLKGESFRGILRTIIGRKENLLTQKHDDCSCLLCRLFGNEHKAGKIRVEDLRILQDSGTNHIDRVALDRFTGGAKDKHKFDMLPRLASPEHPLFFEGKIWISRDLVQKDKDALNRALQDIQNGFYPFGGLGNIGLGWVNYLREKNDTKDGKAPEHFSLTKSIPELSLDKNKIYWPHYFLPFGPKVKRENTPPSHAFMDKKLHSGKLQCSLKTLTPLIIPDSENVREDAEKPEHKIYDFFNLNGTHCIPGSEIRGMVSSVYEALTNSCLRIFDEKKRLSWRMEADRKVLEQFKPGRVVANENGGFKIKEMDEVRYPFYDNCNYSDRNKQLDYFFTETLTFTQEALDALKKEGFPNIITDALADMVGEKFKNGKKFISAVKGKLFAHIENKYGTLYVKKAKGYFVNMTLLPSLETAGLPAAMLAGIKAANKWYSNEKDFYKGVRKKAGKEITLNIGPMILFYAEEFDKKVPYYEHPTPSDQRILSLVNGNRAFLKLGEAAQYKVIKHITKEPDEKVSYMFVATPSANPSGYEDKYVHKKSVTGYLKITGPNKVDKKREFTSGLPPVPRDMNRLLHNVYPSLEKITVRCGENQEYDCIRKRLVPQFMCSEQDKDNPDAAYTYTMSKRCERVFLEKPEQFDPILKKMKKNDPIHIRENAVKKYEILVQEYRENAKQYKTPEAFQTIIFNDTLTEGDLVYFREENGQAVELIPVRISRKVDDMLLAQRLPDDRRPCVREILNENHAEKIKAQGIKEIFQHHPEGLCPGCALFGTGFYKSRVSFGFAFPLSENPSFLNGGNPVTLPLLERPRPTWSIPGKADNAEKKTPVPGRKFYVHHQGWKDVLEKSEEKEESRREKKTENNRSVQVMDKEQEFQFEIRFENLRDWELGLLIYSLQLEKGLAHKLGMGRPLGFGSVEIQVTGIAGDSEISMDEIHEKTSRKLSNLWKAEPEETEAEKNPEKLFALLRYVENENIRVRYPALKKEDSEEKDKPGYMELKEGAFKEEDRQEKLKKPWSYWYKKSKS